MWTNAVLPRVLSKDPKTQGYNPETFANGGVIIVPKREKDDSLLVIVVVLFVSIAQRPMKPVIRFLRFYQSAFGFRV